MYKSKQIRVKLKGMFVANLKLYRYPNAKFGETINIYHCRLVPTVMQELDRYQTTISNWHEFFLGTCNVKFRKTTRIFPL